MKNMAITSYDTCDKIRTDAPLYRQNGSASGRLNKQHFGTNSSTASTVSKREKKISKKYEPKSSPYLSGDTVQLLSRVTEKRFVQKKTMDYMSSFPLAVNIYKASSDEFKTKKRTSKKIKKSVLTLPNEPTPEVQICTVSDVNDSEYYSRTNINCKPRLKRTGIKNFRKPRNKNIDFEFSGTNDRYCSTSNSNINKSSTDLNKKYKGDSNTLSYRTGKQVKKSCLPRGNEANKSKDCMKMHDVWEILRNINRFQFIPSPPMSDESVLVLKKNKTQNKDINRKDTRVIETCRTEEFAYISSYKVDDSLHSLSRSTSFDRITVINKTHEFSNGFEDRFFKVRFAKDNTNRLENRKRIKKRRIKNRNVKNPYSPLTKGQHTELAWTHDTNVNLPNGPENKSDCDEVSSFINVSDLQNIRGLEDTSICSVIKSEMVCTTEPDKHTISSENTSKIEITLDKLNGEKKDVSRTKQLPKLNGILRVANRYEPNTNPLKSRVYEAQNQKSRLVTIIPSARTLPKANKTDMKSRLVNIRYPVIMPGKDQISSSTVVQNIDPPQSDNFDRQICPAKRSDEIIKLKNDEILSKQEKETKDNFVQLSRRMYDSCYRDITSNKLGKSNETVKQSSDEPKKTTDFSNINNKMEPKRTAVSPKSNITQKLKPIDKLKHKMLDLLHKKVPDNNIAKDSRMCSVKMKVDACTEIQTKPTVIVKDPPKIKTCGRPIQFLNRSHNGLKYPWAKAKWASDFIENIIKKIKNGVYFSPDRNSVSRITEASMQTNSASDEDEISCETYFAPKITVSKKKDSARIPGFDRSLLGLELKTLNMKQIAVRHCKTNVMIQFDVTIPTAINEIKMAPETSALVVPLEVTASHTKIFKCNTTILNEMLPAELCNIIPRMMKLIEPTIKSIAYPRCTELDKTISNLSTISELSRNDATRESNTTIIVESLSPVMRILKGAFPKTQIYNSPVVIPCTSLINYDDTHEIDVLPKLRFNNTIILLPQTIKTKEIACFKHIENKRITLTEYVKETPVIYEDQCTQCSSTALEVYSTKNKRLIPAFKQYDFTTFIESIVNARGYYFDTQIQQNCTTIKLYVNVSMQSFKCVYQFSKDVNTLNHARTPNKYIEYIKRSTEDNTKDKNQRSVNGFTVTNKTTKGRSFRKLYRKCKSATNVPSKGKCTNTPLDNIQYLDDFFQILGSNQVFSSVFDGHVGKKIMSSITEMKNWIKNINPRQALLILLLISKKDTPNLIRYRPVLLQGIAVNRITRATELDMEIEVIERENLNKLTQCDGISYLPASIENHDQLLEELYWIAKTTASDYQRPFDESSSERLLKSLLEKRKKLNPSYLRVMARYVGLGLLKTSAKK